MKSSSPPSVNKKNKKDEAVLVAAKPTSHRDLPPLPPNAEGTCSVLLFYQYVEPLWGPTQHKRALRQLMEVCQRHNVTGRGRVAPEGMNCTLTGPPAGIRNVCQGLRDFDKIFWETDFKITDMVPVAKQFKSLSVRKTEELVAYGLKGERVAPSLTKFAGTHLEAQDYHEALQDPDAVVVDVRNFYETALGNFQPPPGGATLMDPKLRNSIEFPKWLAAPETQQALNGKKVLMYCTGGIRCERATALLNQMVAASEANETETPSSPDDKNTSSTTKSDSPNMEKTKQSLSSTPTLTCKPKGVYELRGGIERYVKTFPQGGFWKGKNYLFDRRMEQIPEGRSEEEVNAEIDNARCCVCSQKWTMYRGQYHCASKLCGVPVIVCTSCTTYANDHPTKLQCELCRQQYRLTGEQPDLVQIKRQAEQAVIKDNAVTTRSTSGHDVSPNKKHKRHHEQSLEECYSDRLFVSRLPLTATVTKLREAFLPKETNLPNVLQNRHQHSNKQNKNSKSKQKFQVHWITDPNTRAFYGSCMIQMPNANLAAEVLARAKGDTTLAKTGKGVDAPKQGIRVDKKRIKVSYVRKMDKIKDIFEPPTFQTREYPPIQ